ncbi:hypothetical protein G5714_021456 [Onychostoma macrolepis]|uniref:Uncharacterized protein n=1 Tax=Onychostoma macrolepis TaxID=369639 RepID=A0A7J6BR68_9TELE|nr:hypothetical protein G5714_021456 [Onychostoma macrolepis]
MPGQGSTFRKCVLCHKQINVACKTCRICQGEQPHKLRLKKKLDKFDQKRESWVHAQKKNRTTSHLQDEAYMLLEKLQALGIRAVALLSKPGRRPNEWVSEVLAPRCELTETSHKCLERIKDLYDIVIQGVEKGGCPVPTTVRPHKRKECSHTLTGSQDFYPVKRVAKCRVIKGQKWKQVEWDPCRLCGKKWPLEWVADVDTV